jgi:hypothetical protein
MFIAPIVAVVFLWDDPGSASFVLTAIGLGIVILGILVVANVWKEPHYKVILAWDPEAMPADGKAGRRRYFTINWIQFVTTWAAFALFLVMDSDGLGRDCRRRSPGSYTVSTWPRATLKTVPSISSAWSVSYRLRSSPSRASGSTVKSATVSNR